MLKADDNVFPDMPDGIKNRIRANLDFADEIISVEETKLGNELGKPMQYTVCYKWKNKDYRTTFLRRSYERY